jgi:AmmeMemoRadiSam system protein B/AmmeMemoRadiSam system protein A
MMTRIAAAAVGCLLWVATATAAPAGEIRPAAVAGQFYPADPIQLRGAVQSFLDQAVSPRGRRPVALVLPHAGYLYSGQIAADGFRQVVVDPPEIVVVLAPNHTVPAFAGVALYLGQGFSTPLGVAPIAQDLTRALLLADPEAQVRPEAHQREHAVEVQVPFIQVVAPRARLVAAVFGTADAGVAARFGTALARALRGQRALIVASSDLSHYPGYDDAVAVDHAVLTAVARLDPVEVAGVIAREMLSGRPSLSTCACGQGPMLAAIAAALELGAGQGCVLSYANSGDGVAGDPEKVVGYGAVALFAGAGPPDLAALDRPPPPSAGPLSAADRAVLLQLARRAVSDYLEFGVVPLPRQGSPALRRPQGAFVTWQQKGRLRGCIGHLEADAPLGLTVARMALQAALNDPRFNAVGLTELSDLRLEISALTPFAPVPGPEAIVVGRDGVLLAKGGRQAVFLPQVAPEQGWDRDELLAQLCAKASLPYDCWQHGADLATFQAEVFSEPLSR